MRSAHDTTQTFHVLGHKFQGCFRNALGLGYWQPSQMRDPMYFGVDDANIYAVFLTSTPALWCAGRRGLLPVDRTHPPHNGADLTGFAVFGCRCFPERQKGVWCRGHPRPCRPHGSAPGPVPQGPCEGHRESAKPVDTIEARREFLMGSNLHWQLTRAVHAPRKVETPVRGWERLCGARAATGERHRRRPGEAGPGRAGTAEKPESAAEEDAGEAAAPRPGAPLKTAAERCGFSFPLPAGRGEDGTGPPLLPPPPPPASATSHRSAASLPSPRPAGRADPPALGPSPALLGGLRGRGGTAAGPPGGECLSPRRVWVSLPVACPLVPSPPGLPRRHEHQRRLAPADQHPGPDGAGRVGHRPALRDELPCGGGRRRRRRHPHPQDLLLPEDLRRGLRLRRIRVRGGRGRGGGGCGGAGPAGPAASGPPGQGCREALAARARKSSFSSPRRPTSKRLFKMQVKSWLNLFKRKKTNTHETTFGRDSLWGERRDERQNGNLSVPASRSGVSLPLCRLYRPNSSLLIKPRFAGSWRTSCAEVNCFIPRAARLGSRCPHQQLR